MSEQQEKYPRLSILMILTTLTLNIAIVFQNGFIRHFGPFKLLGKQYKRQRHVGVEEKLILPILFDLLKQFALKS